MNVHLDVRSLLLLPKGQSAEEVEESADLLGCEIVHVVQDSLNKISCSVRNSTRGKIFGRTPSVTASYKPLIIEYINCT